MTHATKATVKRLQAVLKAVDGTGRNYYTDRECAATWLLRYIKAADDVSARIEMSTQYDPDGVKDIQAELMESPYSIYYGICGLTVNGRVDEEQYWLTGLSIKHPELVKYTNCIDINTAIITDVNKLAKLLIG